MKLDELHRARMREEHRVAEIAQLRRQLADAEERARVLEEMFRQAQAQQQQQQAQQQQGVPVGYAQQPFGGAEHGPIWS